VPVHVVCGCRGFFSLLLVRVCEVSFYPRENQEDEDEGADGFSGECNDMAASTRWEDSQNSSEHLLGRIDASEDCRAVLEFHGRSAE
jgi:hypothetical protein